MPLSSSNQFLKTLFQNLQKTVFNVQETVRRGSDKSFNVTLSGALIPLPAEASLSVTLVNTTGNDVSVSINNTVPITLPDKAGVTLEVVNANEISVSGSGTLSYIVSR